MAAGRHDVPSLWSLLLPPVCPTPSPPPPPVCATSCLSVEGERLRRQVLEAWGCWLRLTPVGGGISAAGPALASHPLVAAALEGLSREATFDAAVDAVSAWELREWHQLMHALRGQPWWLPPQCLCLQSASNSQLECTGLHAGSCMCLQ
jgi:hypothetical protein